jgi:DNA-binding NarL/FixJ family response regulator
VIGVAICGDSALRRAQAQTILDAEDGIQVVTEGAFSQVRGLVERAGVVNVLLFSGDLRASEAAILLNGVRRAHPVIPLVVVGELGSPHEVRAALRAGVRGVVHRPAQSGQLAQVIRAVAAGCVVLSRQAAHSLDTDGCPQGAGRPGSASEDPPLSTRERDILQLLARGLSNRDIASRLLLSPHTVKEHISIVCEKLGVNNRVSAAVRAVQAGILDTPAARCVQRNDQGEAGGGGW